MSKHVLKNKRKVLLKTPTDIPGLDEITQGGLPKGRTTLVCGGPGCGKTLFGMEFLVRGATLHDEPGVFISFEETVTELAENVASLGIQLDTLIAKNKIIVEHIYINPNEILETGHFDLKVLFVQIHEAIERSKAKRVVLDTVESLFTLLPNAFLIRTELRNLFHWLKKKKVTSIITGERGESSLTKQGLEEYVSDCVILLDHRVFDQSSIRRLRIVKYRGSTHGTNEYPFLIDEDGFSVLPVTSLGLTHVALQERISTGIPKLDAMLSGKGYYRGSTILVSGTAGTGKTSIAAKFMEAACKRKERVLFFGFEESPSQFLRNMLSIGIDLAPWVKKGLLHFHATRPTLHGLEHHLTTTIKLIDRIKPKVVVLDPIDAFVNSGNQAEVKIMLLRLVDYLKMHNITAFFASLTSSGDIHEVTDVAISSLIDTWLLLREVEAAGERNRVIYILKSRGMKHSHQIREFVLSDDGIDILKVFSNADEILKGISRELQEETFEETPVDNKKEVKKKI